jgi:kumamolisin
MSSRVALRGSYRQHSSKAIKIGRPQTYERLEVTLVLRRRQQAPHPWASDAYHSHEELADLYGADSADIEAVEAIASVGHLCVSHVDMAARTVTLAGAFRDLTSLFGADVELHRLGNRVYRSRRGHLYVPPELAGRVTAVVGFDSRPVVHSQRSAAANEAAVTSYTSREVAGLYNFPAGAQGKGQTIALIELGGGYRTADLNAYWKKLGLDGVHVTAVSVSGATNKPTGDAKSADGEVVLDIEVAGGVASKAKIAVYFAPNTEQGFLKAITAAIHDRVRKPSVISISWGGSEDQWTRQSLDVFNQAFHDAALLGITVFCASGDNGSSDGENDGKAHVDFPASSPWVVACGGTSLKSAEQKIASETAWNNGAREGATGGGVSTFFSAPDYQQGAGVPVSTVRPNFAGRGVPDVAGCADPAAGYSVLVDGTWTVVGGTSAVAPLWAGLTALINEQLGTRVGFMNPLFYTTLAQHKAFNDISSGTNGDFASKPGWDACTGMGSPNGQAILDALKQMQRTQSEGRQQLSRD